MASDITKILAQEAGRLKSGMGRHIGPLDAAWIQEAASVAERDVDWTRFTRKSKPDWKTGVETTVFAPPRDPDDTMPTDANVFAYTTGISAGAVIAATIRALKEKQEPAGSIVTRKETP